MAPPAKVVQKWGEVLCWQKGAFLRLGGGCRLPGTEGRGTADVLIYFPRLFLETAGAEGQEAA